MDHGELIRLKEFLMVFNKLSDKCFRRCVYTLGQATLNGEERTCIDTCLLKNVNVNQKMLSLFMEINPPFQQKKAEEQMAQVKELREAQALAAGNSVAAADTGIAESVSAEATPVSQ